MIEKFVDFQPKTEEEFDKAMKEELKHNKELAKVFQEHPERYELYKRKWFDSLADYHGNLNK